ncbi:MAG: hypothetical protein WDN69_21820 [Aliidongia sp.]
MLRFPTQTWQFPTLRLGSRHVPPLCRRRAGADRRAADPEIRRDGLFLGDRTAARRQPHGRRELFAWRSLSEDGGPVEASNGMRFMADGALAEAASMPSLIVCSSFDPQLYESKRLLAAFAPAIARRGHAGCARYRAHILAKAGLLENQTVTMHWEAVPGFREEFPEIEVSEELFEVQRGCFTCAGGTAALDMMLDMIGRKHGLALARAVSEQFIHDRIRSSSDHQRMERGVRLQITNRKALRIIDLMERNLEQPLDGPALAEAAGITPRQMERCSASCCRIRRLPIIAGFGSTGHAACCARPIWP